MKKYFFLAIGAFIFSACSDEVDLPNEASEIALSEQSNAPRLRSVDEVVEIANEASAKFGKSKSRAARGNLEICCITNHSSSRSIADTLLYVVNYGNNAGFAIISAKTDHVSLLAFTENGTYTDGEDFDNPGMAMMMNNAIAYTTGEGDVETTSTIENPQMMEWVTDTVSIDVEPRLKVAWGTDYLGEEGLPNDNVTCGPIAVAQALSYLKQPSSIVLTYANNEEISLDWDSMITDPYLLNTQRNSLGMEIAYRMGTFTSENHSSTINSGKSVIDNLISGYTGAIYHSAPTLETIKDEGILIVRGSTTEEIKTDGSNGHAFIIDGGNSLVITETTYIVTYLSGTKLVLSREFESTDTIVSECYFHVNWGWSGINNGYFSEKLLIPTQATQYDNRTSTSNDYAKNYQYNQAYLKVY